MATMRAFFKLCKTYFNLNVTENRFNLPTDIHRVKVIFKTFYSFYRYAVDPGPVIPGMGVHIIPGLGLGGSLAALCCWLPWLRSAENSCQTIVYCATDSNLAEQSGLYYSDCLVHLTSSRGSNMEDAYKLWEMSERMAGQ